MENTIKAGTMAEPLKLSPEAKQNLAFALVGKEPLSKEKRIEQESFYEATNAALELSLSIERMRAVAECFADDYIDTVGGITCAQAVAHTERHFENLYNALFMMIVGVDEQAQKLHHDLDEIWKSA